MDDSGSSDVELLVFDAGGRTYGLASKDVIELVRAVSITALPNGPRVVSGVIDLRGKIIPVFDMKVRFGQRATPVEPSDHFIIARAGRRTVAIRADRASKLANVRPEDLEFAELIVSGTNHYAGIAKLGDGMALITDLDTFLSDAEAATLDEALSASEATP
jgi:purine-binding chemotaxis protein CheW